MDNNNQGRVKRVLISEDDIRNAVQSAGEQLAQIYEGKPVLLVSVLKGAFIFLGDLCRCMNIPCRIDFMEAKSYLGNSTESCGQVEITMDLKHDISKYHVIIVEDIIDTGRTLSQVIKILKERNPLSLRIITLLDKPARRTVKLEADVSLFTIPDYFVVGYGLDYNGYHRNLPYIAEFEE
ncbi:MAG: hypoxanthine phosphoribosyltransferase [Ruminococcus sp.]|nr:hypoxanthine phosphoribosyltransferase [Ruminococcus sp.]